MTTEALPPRVLIADSHVQRRDLLRLRLSDYVVELPPPTEEALLGRISASRPAAVVLGTLGAGGFEMAVRVISSLHETLPEIKIILLADQSSEDHVIRALRAGVHDYLKAPVLADDVASALMRLLPANRRVTEPRAMVGSSDQLRRIRTLMERLSPSDGAILITGETGTGKELIARGVHRLSSRSARPLICFNCSAVPDTLVESELFGYEKGAFTGAAARQTGLLTQAHGGTLFLDEVGEMSAHAQAKILRAVETGEVQPLGAGKPHQVDIRVIAATHRDLTELVAQNKFREDLFFRLNVIPIYLPSLRQRREDIPDLVRHFLNQYNAHYQRSIEGFTPAALQLLCSQDWPGNIRQLRNVVQAGFLICDGGWISEADLRELHWDFARSGPVETVASSRAFSHSPVLPEPDRLLSALQATSWNKSKAAELLHWSRMTVYRKIAKYKLEAVPADADELSAAQAC